MIIDILTLPAEALAQHSLSNNDYCCTYIVGGIIQNLGQSGSASGAAPLPLPGLWADCDCEAGSLWGGNLLRGSWETLLHRCGVNFRASVSISAEGWYVKAFRHVINFFRSVLLCSLRMYIQGAWTCWQLNPAALAVGTTISDLAASLEIDKQQNTISKHMVEPSQDRFPASLPAASGLVKLTRPSPGWGLSSSYGLVLLWWYCNMWTRVNQNQNNLDWSFDQISQLRHKQFLHLFSVNYNWSSRFWRIFHILF